MSSRVGAFGDSVANTPHLDALAQKGIIYTNVFTTAGVCSPSRVLYSQQTPDLTGSQHICAQRHLKNLNIDLCLRII